MSDRKIDIVYQIAVIINESGLMRNWYSNVLPYLNDLNYHPVVEGVLKDRYDFTAYTRSNLANLFDESKPDYITNYDAVFISTNATNDDEVYNLLVSNAKIIEEYLNDNKGLFIGSQKKISKDVYDEATKAFNEGTVGFLPELWSYELKRRSSHNSSKGHIEIYAEDDCIVAGKEKSVAEQEINQICMDNSFKAHKFRSFIIPKNEDIFETVLVDKTSQSSTNSEGALDEINDPIVRKLLIRCKNKKIVYSSIALDYENQKFLLANIIEYIVKGMPLVAFVGNSNLNRINDRKFSYLYLNARIGKLALSEYSALDYLYQNSSNRIFVVSSNFSEESVNKFWNGLCNKNRNNSESYLRLLHLKKGKNRENIITEYTNYSIIDIIIKNVFTWIITKYTPNYNSYNVGLANNKISSWGTDYWITYDVFCFLYELNCHYINKYSKCYEPYLLDYFMEIEKKHYRVKGDTNEIGSYDGMLNCSSALLELFCLFDIDELKKQYPELRNLSIERTFDFIKRSLQNSSVHQIDSETALISLNIIKNHNCIPRYLKSFYDIEESYSFYSLLDSIIEKRIVHQFGFRGEVNKLELPIIEDRYRNITETELCTDIEIICIKLRNESELKRASKKEIDLINIILYNHLRALLNLQKNGCWENAARTAAMLKRLIRCTFYEKVENYTSLSINYLLQQIIMISANYLLKEYKETTGDCWNGDMLATANAIYSLCLYNLQNKNMMNDLLDSVIYSKNIIESTDVMIESANSLTNSRMRNLELSRKIEMVNAQLTQAQREASDKEIEVKSLKKEITSQKEQYEEKNKKAINDLQIRFGLRVQVFMWITFTIVVLYILHFFNLFSMFGKSKKEIAIFSMSLIIGATVAEIMALIRGVISNFQTTNPVSVYIYRRMKKTKN